MKCIIIKIFFPFVTSSSVGSADPCIRGFSFSYCGLLRLEKNLES